MLIPLFAGISTALIGVACWSSLQLYLNLPQASSWSFTGSANGYLHFAPISIAIIAAAFYASLKTPFARSEPLPDLLENYFYGFFRLKPALWLQRALTSFLTAILIGIFGIEGVVLELASATHPWTSRGAGRLRRLFIEEKQSLILCTISGAFAFAFNAPFSGCLVALELTQTQESRVRIGAIVASIVSFATANIAEHALFPHYFIDHSGQGNMLLGQLFTLSHSLRLENTQWAGLALATAGVAFATSLVALLNSRMITFGLRFFNGMLEHRKPMIFLLGGLLLSLTLALNSEFSAQPQKLMEDLAWLRISGSASMLYFLTYWVLLVIAFVTWGTTGIFTPYLVLGALFGYFSGSLFSSEWSVPLAIIGAFSLFSSVYGLSLSMIAIVIELDGIGPLWWLTILAVTTVKIASWLLKLKPLHKSMFEINNVRISNGRVTSVLSKIKVEDSMYRDFQTLAIGAGVQELRQAALHTSHNFLGIVSGEGKYVGLLALEQLPLTIRKILKADATAADVLAVERVLEIRYLIDTDHPVLSPDDTAEKALLTLQKTPCVAVVDSEKVLRGLLFESSIAGRYKREIANISIRQG